MSESGHSHKKSHRKNSKGSFFDRLRGRKSSRHSSEHHHVSGFPGINLPREYDLTTGEHDEIMDRPPVREQKVDDIPAHEEHSKDFSGNVPDKVKDFRADAARFKPAKKRTFAESVSYYFKKRAQEREERQKEKLKRKIRLERQREYRRKESGRSLGKKLFSWGEEGEDSDEKKVPLFSQRSPLFRTLTIIVNSTMIFMFSYVLVYLFYWLTCMLVASWYGLDSTLYYYDLEFNNHSPLWSRFNILLVTGIPPFMSLALGTFLLRVVFKKERWVGLQKLFILWTGFHLLNHFFGAFPSGVVTSEGFGYVAAWMYMNTAFKFMFSILSLFALGVIGFYSAEMILETSDSPSRIKPANRVAFILSQVAIPWFIGTALMLLIRLPMAFDYPYETLMFFSMVFLVFPPFFNEKVKPRLNLMKVKKRRYVNIGYLAMMLVMVSFLRIMLGIGLHFLIEINISITPAVS